MTEQPAYSTADLDRMLAKIKGLLATAGDPATPEEAAETYRAKAEALMHKYRVDENMLIMRGGTQAAGIVPVWRRIWVSPVTSEFEHTYTYMASNAVSHVGGKAASGWDTHPEHGTTWRYLEAVGYDSDLRYADVIFTAMSLAFASKMEPKVDRSLTDAENAYNMRSAGMEGWKISQALWNRDDKAARSKARRLFAQHAATLGEDSSALLGQGNSVSSYRTSYASGFETEMWGRLARMRQGTGTDGAMVLKSRSENVKEAFYSRYEHLRPRPAGDQPALGGRDTCEKCKAAKSGYCRDHGHLRPRKSDYRSTPFHAAGYARGQVAAQSVDLGGTERRVRKGGATAIG